MSSPFVESFTGGASPCDQNSCEPFYIREWETMIVGTLLVLMLLYICNACGGSSYFSSTKGSSVGSNTADSGSNRFGARDDRAGQDNNAIFNYTPDMAVVKAMPQISRFSSGGTTCRNSRFSPPTANPLKYMKETTPGRDGVRSHFNSQGPNTSKFMDFATVDGIDSLKKNEPIPSHMPETSEQALADVVGVP